MGTKYLWYCPQCHCTDVQIKAWIKPNCNDHVVDIDAGEETGWCPKCEEHLNLEFEVLTPVDSREYNKDRPVWWDNKKEPLHSGIYFIEGIQNTGFSAPKALVDKCEPYSVSQWAPVSELYYLPNNILLGIYTCTDPDNHQYCRKINDHCYSYKEFNRLAFSPEYLKKNSLTIEGLFHNDEYWIEDNIDMDGYTEEEIRKHISAYYKDLDDIKSIYGDNWKQIVCECIFEQESELY